MFTVIVRWRPLVAIILFKAAKEEVSRSQHRQDGVDG